MKKEELLTETLFSVTIEKSDDGTFKSLFKVHSEGGTINEFTFGTDEKIARDKTNHLVQNILLGLEYVQHQVREAYGDGEDEAAIEEPQLGT